MGSLLPIIDRGNLGMSVSEGRSERNRMSDLQSPRFTCDSELSSAESPPIADTPARSDHTPIADTPAPASLASSLYHAGIMIVAAAGPGTEYYVT